MTTQRQASASAAIPPLGWLLVGLTVAYVIGSYMARGPMASNAFVPPISQILGTAALFGLAAALVIAADHWRAGRSWLRRAAVAFVVAGALAVAYELYITLFLLDAFPIGEWPSVLLAVRAITAAAATAAGVAMVGIGLWVARPARRVVAGRWEVVAIGGLGLVAAAGTVAYGVGSALSLDKGYALVAALAWSFVTGLARLAMAFVAFAALRYRPFRDHLAEVVIAVGAVLALVASSVGDWVLAMVPMQDIDASLVGLLPLPAAVQAAGWLTIVGGVGIGWWLDGRSERSSSARVPSGV